MGTHLTETVLRLKESKKYDRPLFLITGDFNDLKTKEISDTCKLKQVVKVPTRNKATLDLILTNQKNKLYKNPRKIPSIGTSDHLCVLYEPIGNQKSELKKEKNHNPKVQRVCNHRIWRMASKIQLEPTAKNQRCKSQSRLLFRGYVDYDRQMLPSDHNGDIKG